MGDILVRHEWEIYWLKTEFYFQFDLKTETTTKSQLVDRGKEKGA